jgi:hypothetical protein
MEMYRAIVSAMKVAALNSALDRRISISNTENLEIGSLVPVGEWILPDDITLEKITNWRRRFNRMFPTRNSVDIESTRRFIEKSYICNPGSILFLIFTDKNEMIGHIGICGLENNSYELVNLIRGASGGNEHLIYFAELSLLKFGFALGHHDGCFVEIMSYNWMVANLHQKVGFVKTGSTSLQKLEDSIGTRHQRVPDIEKNVDYTIDLMSISRNAFYNLHSEEPS